MSKVHSCKGFKMSTSLTSFLLFAFFLGCASAPAPTETQTFDEEDSDDYITDFIPFVRLTWRSSRLTEHLLRFPCQRC